MLLRFGFSDNEARDMNYIECDGQRCRERNDHRVRARPDQIHRSWIRVRTRKGGITLHFCSSMCLADFAVSLIDPKDWAIAELSGMQVKRDYFDGNNLNDRDKKEIENLIAIGEPTANAIQ